MTPRRTLIVAVAAVLLCVLAGTAWAAFASKAVNPTNSFRAKPDFRAPTASASVVGRADGTVGPIRPGGSYHVYASVSDAGNPPSGTASVRANMTAVTAGQSAAALASGSFTFNGVSYSYRSGSLTADSGLADGTYAYSLTSTDVAGKSRTQTGFTAQVAAPATPTFRAATSATSGTASGVTSITVASPAAQNGDLLIAAVVASDSAVVQAPAGWTAYDASGIGGLTVHLFRRTATSSEPASHTFTADVSARLIGGIVAYQNVTDSTQKAVRLETTGVATHVTSTLTTSADARLLAIYTDMENNARSWTSSDTERLDVNTTGGRSSDITLAIYDTTFLAPGTYQRSATSTAPSKNAVMYLIALK